MLNFAVGPVMMDKKTRKIGGNQIPYFRTSEFSSIMKENEFLIKKISHAPVDSKVVFLTSSGTGAMEAAIINFFDKNDKLLVINGGGFGKRFSQICALHELDYYELIPKFGCSVTMDDLQNFKDKGYTGLLVNMHETSIGVLYDMKLISDFCRENGIRLVVDAISSFIADEIDLTAIRADVLIIGSQKALAVAPGISILVLSDFAIKRINNKSAMKSYYFNLKEYLTNIERGQTPYTPAISVLLQLNLRLKSIDKIGIDNERKKIESIAKDFRDKIRDLPFEFVSKSPSNAVTCLSVRKGVSAKRVFEVLKNDYGIFICPNGGDFADSLFRVGHIGDLSKRDNSKLVRVFKKLEKRGII